MQFNFEESVHQSEEQDIEDNAQAKQNDMQFNFKESLHQSEEQDVEDNAQSKERLDAEDTDIASTSVLATYAVVTSVLLKVIPEDDDRAATLAVSLPNATDATDDRTEDGKKHDQVTLIEMRSLGSNVVTTTLADNRPFRSRKLSQYLRSTYTALEFGKKQDTVEKNRYIGTLANADAKFFSDFAREDCQQEDSDYIPRLRQHYALKLFANSGPVEE
ncbi:hypothetical protein Dimus_022684 [Dionaea muscipula]